MLLVAHPFFRDPTEKMKYQTYLYILMLGSDDRKCAADRNMTVGSLYFLLAQ